MDADSGKHATNDSPITNTSEDQTDIDDLDSAGNASDTDSEAASNSFEDEIDYARNEYFYYFHARLTMEPVRCQDNELGFSHLVARIENIGEFKPSYEEDVTGTIHEKWLQEYKQKKALWNKRLEERKRREEEEWAELAW